MRENESLRKKKKIVKSFFILSVSLSARSRLLYFMKGIYNIMLVRRINNIESFFFFFNYCLKTIIENSVRLYIMDDVIPNNDVIVAYI